MAAIATLPVLFATGNHAGRPAASAVGAGGLYSCTTHGLLYQTDGSSWTTWATLGTGTTTTTVATDPIWNAAGDLVVGTGADTAARLGVGTNGEVLTLVAGSPSWEPNGGPADILDIPTAEMDDTLVLAPDGAGGVEFRAEAGGGGGDLTRLAETVLGSDAADITFTGISNAYRDLILVVDARAINAGNDWAQLNVRVGNGSIDTGNNYGYARNVTGSGSASTGGVSGQGSITTGSIPSATATANAFGSMELSIRSYANTTHFKSMTGMGYGTGASEHYVAWFGGTWRATSAIDQVRVYCPSGDMKTGSRAALYGRA